MSVNIISIVEALKEEVKNLPPTMTVALDKIQDALIDARDFAKDVTTVSFHYTRARSWLKDWDKEPEPKDYFETGEFKAIMDKKRELTDERFMEVLVNAIRKNYKID